LCCFLHQVIISGCLFRSGLGPSGLGQCFIVCMHSMPMFNVFIWTGSFGAWSVFYCLYSLNAYVQCFHLDWVLRGLAGVVIVLFPTSNNYFRVLFFAVGWVLLGSASVLFNVCTQCICVNVFIWTGSFGARPVFYCLYSLNAYGQCFHLDWILWGSAGVVIVLLPTSSNYFRVPFS
jgi:hypothetical protein